MMGENEYKSLILKKPKQSADYVERSDHLISVIGKILDSRIKSSANKIMINTNLKLGLPMENINKIAGPFIEAWAFEVFSEELENKNYNLVSVEAGERLNMADVLLQFKRGDDETVVAGNVDVKATSKDIKNSGKSPNITSFARIRTAYVENPDFIFIILSLKHKVYSTRDSERGLMNGVMEVVDYNVYDLKHISSKDISYNPALGSGQLQIRDIHYVEREVRTALEFCELLDAKVIKSKKGFKGWLEYAARKKWIKD